MTQFSPDPQDDELQPQTQPDPGWQTRRDDTPAPTPEPQVRAPRFRIFKPASPAQPHQEHPRASLFAHPIVRHAHRHMRRAFLAVTFTVTVLGIALVLLAVSFRHDMRAALPQLDGTLHVPGLTYPVTVTRNSQGVPSINASTIDDVLFAQGFVTAQDRLWQMDALRRHASGQLAQILGASMIDHDRLQRTLQISEAADRALAVLPPDQLHQLLCYSRGVNAFIQQAIAKDTLPVEFHVLHYQPVPWTPHDSMLVYLALVQDLSTGFPVKLRREALAQHLPPQLLADLYPVGSWRDHPPTQPTPDLSTPVTAVEQIPLDRTQSQLATPADILHLAHELPGSQCAECRAGSNNWAVAGTYTASGLPLVSNDMHLNLGVPDIWYEAALHVPASAATPALDVTGFTLPGMPFVVVGRNAHVAWSFTNLGGDVQDVRIEHTRGSGKNLEFEQPNGSWTPVQHHIEHIIVRGSRNITLDVLTTTETFGPSTIAAQPSGVQEIQTPIITPLLPSEHRTLSLAWTIYDPSTLHVPFLAANMASSGAALVAALSTFQNPSLNLVYADDQDHIGYHAIGAIPVRGSSVQRPRELAPTILTGSTPPDEQAEQDDQNQQDPQDQQDEQAEQDQQAQSTPTAPLQNQPPPPSAPSDKPGPDYTIGSQISPVPVSALDASQIWSGYIPYDQLPNIVDPPNGFLATANARITPDDYPYSITLNWGPPYRAERIYKLLNHRSELTSADMLTVQTDEHSAFDHVFAQRLAYAIDHASPAILAHDPKRLHQAADILRSWDGNLTIDSVAPNLVTATHAQLLSMLLRPQIAAYDKLHHVSGKTNNLLALYDWSSETVAVENLLEFTPVRWLPPNYHNWNNFLTAALLQAMHNNHAPRNLSTWRYGKEHTVSIEHPVFNTIPFMDRLLGTPTGTGPRETGGDTTSIKSIRTHFGPSERFTADLSNSQATAANITTGESGDPISPHYFDQFLPWLNGTTFTLPLTATQPVHALTLLP
jgi:penicillin amidase